jgi:thioredoxin reductase (NADPH)
MLDCLVIGGGPAGLTAAIYLARFHLTVAVADAGGSRALSIPMTRNHAGFPNGIAGAELVRRMREQAAGYGAALIDAEIIELSHDEGGFVANARGGDHRARAVLLATGVVNRRPAMPDDQHDLALAKGLLRYCPICDGYEVTDRRVGVIGTGEHGAREAVFLRSYTSQIELIAPDGRHDLTPETAASLVAAGIVAIHGPIRSYEVDNGGITVSLDGAVRRFDSIYPALGSTVRSELAAMLGATTSAEACLIVDGHQRTSVPGLYAAGDVVLGLDQISHAMGEGGVAATTIRNDLAAARPLRR